MSQLPTPGAIAPPSTPVGAARTHTVASIGWFWGLMFALPVGLFTVWLAVFTFSVEIPGRNHDPAGWAIAVGMIGLALCGGILVGGRWWAALGQRAPLLARICIAIAMGCFWTLILVGVRAALFGLLDGFHGVPITPPGPGLVTWSALLALYAYQQGTIIRWRIRKLKAMDEDSMGARDSA